MSVITNPAPSLAGARVLGLAPDALSRSLGRLAAGLRATGPADGDADDLTAASTLQAQCRQAEAGAADVQNGLSYAQAADGYVGDMTEIVTRMGELAGAAKNGGDAATEFSTLQQQLRDIIGGTTAEIGGATDTDPTGTFNGAPLFGNAPAPAVTTGAGESVTLPGLNLRSGAMAALIAQDGSGTFTAGAGDATMPQTLAAALDQLAGQHAALGTAQAQLQTAASSLQIEASNLNAAFAPIDDVGSAAAATQDARSALLGDPTLALLAHASQVPGAALKILNA